METKILSSKIDKLNEYRISRFVNNIQNGVPIATPVFDGAKEKDVTKMLDIAKITKLRTNILVGWKNRRKI